MRMATLCHSSPSRSWVRLVASSRIARGTSSSRRRMPPSAYASPSWATRLRPSPCVVVRPCVSTSSQTIRRSSRSSSPASRRRIRRATRGRRRPSSQSSSSLWVRRISCRALRLSSQVCRSSSRITSARTPTPVPTSIFVVVLPSQVQLTSRSSSSTGRSWMSSISTIWI